MTKIFSLALSLLIFQCAEDTPTDTPVTYTVTFNTNGGSTIKNLTVTKDAKANKPADPTRDGYTFEGWYSDQATTTAYDFGTPITANLTLYAKWTAVETFTVTFNANGGSAVDSLTVAKDAKANKPADPTRDGYTFEGWYTDQATTTAYDFDSPVTANVTLYAKWEKGYRVTFSTAVGNTIPPQSVDSAGMATKPADPTKEGYAFVGWYTDSTDVANKYDFNTTVTTDITLYARWINIPDGFAFIPDDNFRAALKRLIPEAFNDDLLLDTTHNDVVTRTVLNVRFSEISSLEGVQYFTALTGLDCGFNRLTSLDVAKNTALTTLECYGNQLTNLDVSGNAALTQLVCYGNRLTSLDVSENTALTELFCNENQLTSLDITGMRSTFGLSINAGSSGKNPLTVLKVHDLLKTHDEVKEVKTNRGNNVTIKVYKVTAGTTTYTEECADYNPNTDTCL